MTCIRTYMICLAAALFYCVQEGERNRETTVDKEAVNGVMFREHTTRSVGCTLSPFRIFSV